MIVKVFNTEINVREHKIQYKVIFKIQQQKNTPQDFCHNKKKIKVAYFTRV